MAVQGMFAPGPVHQVVVSALLGANLVLASRVGRVSPPLMRAATGLATAGVLVNLAFSGAGTVDDGEVRVMNALVAIVGPPAVALGVIRSLRASRVVGIEAVSGVLSLYMMLGLLFAFIYGAVDRLGGDPFFAGDAAATVANRLYFSFTTLTTVGYGDFSARTDLGHTLCVFEALIGQIYLVTVVSLIVSNLGRRDPR